MQSPRFCHRTRRLALNGTFPSNYPALISRNVFLTVSFGPAWRARSVFRIAMMSQPDHTTDYSKCPIPVTHRRLAESHLLWHQSLDNYSQPDRFRANLNSTIQALRNVTWALQSEKLSIAGFDEWYKKWQMRLAADATSKWLISARNLVVKQGDLEIGSDAVLRVLTYTDKMLTEAHVPPGISNEVILKNLPLFDLIRESGVPAIDLKHAGLEIERRWSIPELGGREILEALAWVYGLVSDLILDAHALLNRLDCIPSEPAHSDFISMHHRTGLLGCMAFGKEQRSERISLATGTRYYPQSERIPDYPDVNNSLYARRYGFDEHDRVPSWQSDPIAIAESVVRRAKRILRKDRNHARMMFVRDGKGHWHHSILVATDLTEKYLLMRALASYVERIGVDALIEVGEVWTLSKDAI